MTAAWDVYGQLVARYARQLVEPVVPGPPRPDLQALMAAGGLEVVDARTVERSFVLADEADWWAWTLSHGHRIFLDGLSVADREEFREEAVGLMRPHVTEGGYPMVWRTEIVVATRPAW